MCPEAPDLSSGVVVFALLLNKSAIGIYSSHANAMAARHAFQDQNPAAGFLRSSPSQWMDRR